jgi:hypothetical protein
MKPESRPSSEQGLTSAVNLAGPLITSCSRSVLALHLKRLFDNAGLPTTKPRDSALRGVTKEVVGIHVLLTRKPSAAWLSGTLEGWLWARTKA